MRATHTVLPASVILHAPNPSPASHAQILRLNRTASSDPVKLLATPAGSAKKYVVWEVDMAPWRASGHMLTSYPWEGALATKLVEWATTGIVPEGFTEAA